MNTKLVKEVAEELFKANNTVTTLEIKVALRKKYPNQSWYQSDISQVMDDLQNKGEYIYSDTGTYRVYSKVKTNTKSKVVTKAKQPTVVVKNKNQRVSKTKAIELMQNSNGRFFGVTFTKKDGSVRKMQCKVEKGTKANSLGYLLVVDVKEAIPKSLNLQTLSELRMNKTTYKIA